ncbi:MAG: Zinc ribbon domain [Solirubrobacteraceae bacterium]|nr:Zinc ribbon domain [Solirubrobacteraceae bacterium]
MPRYDYACPACGPFEGLADAAAAGAGAVCPSCGEVAARTFSAPGGRGPRRRRLLGGLDAAALTRVERAEAGAASAGALPPGTPVDRGGRPQAQRGAAAARRPWQLGH